jgi:hypothetical protein
MAKKTQPRTHAAMTGKRYGSFASKPNTESSIIEQRRIHEGVSFSLVDGLDLRSRDTAAFRLVER